MTFILLIAAGLLGLAATYGPAIRVELRHRRRARARREALRQRALRQVLRSAARMTREVRR